jgi:hypothetical protein
MDRVGISFKSPLSPEEVRERFIVPLRQALESHHAGIYSNYLRQLDPDDGPPEHLLVFHVHDFQEGLRVLRVELERIGVPGEASLHNLNASDPMY